MSQNLLYPKDKITERLFDESAHKQPVYKADDQWKLIFMANKQTRRRESRRTAT